MPKKKKRRVETYCYNKAELEKIGYNKTYNNIDEFIEQRKNNTGPKKFESAGFDNLDGFGL